MNLIRVDPPYLHNKARELGEIAAAWRALADRALRAALSAPSYDGEFAPILRVIAAEAYARFKSLADSLEHLSQDLHQKAKEFDEADAESRAGLRAWGVAFAQLRHSMHRLASETLHSAGFTWEQVAELLGLEDEDGTDDEAPPPAAPLALWFLQMFGQAVEGAQGLTNLGAYGLWRASQGAEGLANLGWYGLWRASEASEVLVNIGAPRPLAESTNDPEIRRLRNQLWSNPEAMAAALTRNRRGREYLEHILPEISRSQQAGPWSMPCSTVDR